MTNEEKLKRIVANPTLWIQSFVKIVDKNSKLVPFKPNIQQKELLDSFEKYNLILKSRQLGITSVSCGLSLYYANTQPNTTCLLMSYSIDSAQGIFEKLKQMYNDLPKAIKVPLINNNRKELKFTNGSRIIIATCGTKDVARGLTIKFAHLSEVAFMKDTVGKQLLAIEQSLVPNGTIFLESTANGLNEFSELWGKAERKESLYKNFFFSWIDDKVMFADEYKMLSKIWVERHGSMLTEDELDDMEKHLFTEGATIEQLVWRRLKIGNSSIEQFQQEFPSNPIEAFVSSGSNIFDSTRIHQRTSYIIKNNHIGKPSDLPNSVKAHYGRSFFMWDSVKKGEKYYFGVDTSEGLKQDYSVIEIIDSQGVQVGEFSSNSIKPYQFAEVVNELGIYFNYAYLVIEKASAGHVIVSKLKDDYHYKNLYKAKEYDVNGRAKKKAGFITNSKTKPMMIMDFVELFEQGQILINSKELLGEMKLFTLKGNKMEASNGHDDKVMAFAMALVGLKSGINYVQ